ncbi:MAG: TetR/AcrR family transcriptional regulator [Acidimicrobiia bacterium]|nr:TetR/AcrR family transcriptional regulator [Acidimicrobiia bacterium]
MASIAPREQVRQSSPPDAAPGVDPRVARTRAAVLRVATDLLVEGGAPAVTIEAIVARSGVAKSTIYRHWDTRDDVLLEVIANCAPRIEAPDESLDFEGSLRAFVAALRRTLDDPDWARVLPALLALRTQSHGIADLEQRIEKRQEDAVEVVLRRGMAEGRLAPDVDLDQATALLVGPLLFAVLMDKPAVDEALCDRVVDAFLGTFAPDTG